MYISELENATGNEKSLSENENSSTADEKVIKTPEEARQQQPAPMDGESQVKPEAASDRGSAVTTTALVPSKQHTVQTPPIELNIPGDRDSSGGSQLRTSKEAAMTVDLDPKVKSSDISLSLKDVIPDTEDDSKTVLESSLLKTCSDLAKATIPSNSPSSSTSKVLEVKTLKSGEENKNNLPTPESALSIDNKGLPVLTAEKSADESQTSDSQNTQIAQVTIATTQLPSRTNSVESKLSVAVVSNSPPSVSATIMNKSISPVIKAVSSSKPVDIVTSVSVPSTVTVTTNTSAATSAGVVYTGSIPFPIVTSAVRPAVPPVCSSVSVTSAGKSVPLPSSIKKISPQFNTLKHSLAAGHAAVSSTVAPHSDKQILGVTSSIPVVSSKSNIFVTNVQSRTPTSVPMQAKVCIVTTAGNTKVAIHTLNSVAEPGNVHHVATAQRALLKPGLIQTGTKVQNAVNDNVSKGSTAMSIMIRDITKKVDSVSESSAADVKLEVLKPKSQVGLVHSEDSGKSSRDMINAKHMEKIPSLANKVVHYNLQHGPIRNPVASVIPNISHAISKSQETKKTLHDHIDSIVNASRNVNQNHSRLQAVTAVGNSKNVAVNCGPSVAALQSKVAMTAKQSEAGVVNTGDSRHPQVLSGHGGRTTGQLTANPRSNQLPATSNLDSGTATAAIQAVAAHVKATQGTASQASGTSPPEQQKRQSKGISILKPLYDKEFELDDNEMDPKVPTVPVPQKKSTQDPEASSKNVEDSSSHPKVAYDSTAFSIAQILDHAKRAMAEEKQQKESKVTTGKDRTKSTTGKGVKTPKQGKPTSVNKTVPPAAVSNPVAHDFPFNSNVHLSNFVQKSKQTPAVVNSTTHTPAHPIMAPEFHLNLTESVQKVMQAIPGSDALSPPPCPPKVVRPGSVFTKFNEDGKQDISIEDSETISQTSTTTTTTAVTTTPVVVTTVSTSVITQPLPVPDSLSLQASAPVTLHKASPSLPIVTSAVSAAAALSPGSRTITIASPHKTPTPSAVITRKTPTPPSAMSALRNTPTPPAAVVPSTQQVMSRKTPTPPAATVPPTLLKKSPTPVSMSQPHTNARVVSPHNTANRNTPTPPFSRNTPTPPGTSTVIHSRSPQSTPPAKEIPKVKGPGVKFEIMPQPHGASTIVVIKSDNKDPTPPPTSDATQTIILGHKDIIRKPTVSSGKADNVTVITTHKPEMLRKVAPTIIVPSSSTAASSSAITLSQISQIHKQSGAPVLTAKSQPQSQWKRVDVTTGSHVRNIVPQISRVTPVMKTVASLQSRIAQSKSITAITVVNPVKQMFVGTTVATLGTPTTASEITTSPRSAAIESSIHIKQPGVDAGVSASPVRFLVTTVKPAVTAADTKPIVHQPVRENPTVISKVDDVKPAKAEVTKTLKVEDAKPVTLTTEDIVVPVTTVSQISPKIEAIDQESNHPAKKTSRKRSADKELDKVEVEQELPNNNNKNEKTTRKSTEGHGSEEVTRPARVTRRRSRESTESQQSTANSESGRSTRSSRRRGASESSDISISSDGHNTDVRSTPSTRSSVDRSESPPRASRHSTRSSTRKRTSADREENVAAATAKAEKERSVSPVPGKGTRASKRKLVMEEAADDHDGKKAKVDAAQSDSKTSDSNENESKLRRTGAKADAAKASTTSLMKEPNTTPASRRAASRTQKVENVELADDHTYSGTRRANTRSSGNTTANAEAKDDTAHKKTSLAAKKGKFGAQIFHVMLNMFCKDTIFCQQKLAVKGR